MNAVVQYLASRPMGTEITRNTEITGPIAEVITDPLHTCRFMHRRRPDLLERRESFAESGQRVAVFRIARGKKRAFIQYFSRPKGQW